MFDLDWVEVEWDESGLELSGGGDDVSEVGLLEHGLSLDNVVHSSVEVSDSLVSVSHLHGVEGTSILLLEESSIAKDDIDNDVFLSKSLVFAVVHASEYVNGLSNTSVNKVMLVPEVFDGLHNSGESGRSHDSLDEIVVISLLVSNLVLSGELVEVAIEELSLMLHSVDVIMKILSERLVIEDCLLEDDSSGDSSVLPGFDHLVSSESFP